MPFKAIEMTQAAFAVRFLALRVPGPDVKYRSPSCQCTPMPATCGRPSGRVVARKKVVPGCSGPSTSRSWGRLHGSAA